MRTSDADGDPDRGRDLRQRGGAGHRGRRRWNHYVADAQRVRRRQRHRRAEPAASAAGVPAVAVASAEPATAQPFSSTARGTEKAACEQEAIPHAGDGGGAGDGSGGITRPCVLLMNNTLR